MPSYLHAHYETLVSFECPLNFKMSKRTPVLTWPTLPYCQSAATATKGIVLKKISSTQLHTYTMVGLLSSYLFVLLIYHSHFTGPSCAQTSLHYLSPCV